MKKNKIVGTLVVKEKLIKGKTTKDWYELHEVIRKDFTRVLKEAELARKCCDILGLALVNHKHLWTAEERSAYDKAFKEDMQCFVLQAEAEKQACEKTGAAL